MNIFSGNVTNPRLKAEAATRCGSRHDVNEDAYHINIPHGLFTVADGMGGHSDGDFASQECVHAITRLCEYRPAAHDRQLIALETALSNVSRELFLATRTRANTDICGCTSISLIVNGSCASCLWAGDSRLYLMREHHLFMISRDHADEEGRLTSAIGISDQVAFSRRTLEIKPDDTFILCSDGLLKGMDEATLANMSAEGRSGLAERLVARAITGGSTDDVTVVIVWEDVYG